MAKPYKKNNPPTNVVDLLTVSEAASVFAVTPTTIRNWDKSGKLPSYRHPENGYRLYSFSDLAKVVPESQRPLFVENKEPEEESVDTKGVTYQSLKDFRLLVRQMSKAFRDSQGGGLMERFEEISKILYTKMFDERRGGKVFIIRSNQSDEAIYELVAATYKEAVAVLPQSFRDHGRELSRDKKAVAQIVKMLSGLSLLKVPTDIKGTVFEELVKNTFDKTEHQQFFTPRTVVNFVIKFVDINGAKTVLDPACGTAGFLIEAATEASRKNTQLIGVEIDKRMAWISQMNLQIHGVGENQIYCFPNGGSLNRSGEIQEKIPDGSVEIIVTNPPFGSDFNDLKELKNYSLGTDRKSRRRGAYSPVIDVIFARPI